MVYQFQLTERNIIMLKKITLAAAIIFSAVALVAAPKVRVDQSSQRAVCETLLRSLAYQDVDAFWMLIPAETRTALNAEGVSKNDIFQLLCIYFFLICLQG